MDVFAITCQKHICYVESSGDGYPMCPKGHARPIAEKCSRTDWHIFQSDNHMVELTESVRNAVHDLNGIVNRLNNRIRPTV